DTVYRHTPGPVELLAEVLGEELDQLTVRASLADEGIPAAEYALLSYIARRIDIYRGALITAPSGRIRDLLHQRLQDDLSAWLRTHPDLAPAVDGPVDALARQLYVAYAASGTVGAIEKWLTTDDLSDPEHIARIILAASPQWWLT
ncbi:MAG: TetR-like C-terminal domain-containing protein, partial [Microbacterium sp.]